MFVGEFRGHMSEEPFLEGNFEFGVMNGSAVSRFDDGSSIQGPFVNDLPHGIMRSPLPSRLTSQFDHP